MKSWVKVFGILAVALIVMWQVGRVTHTLRLFTISTGSNYPAVKPVRLLFSSILIQPKRFSFMLYKVKSPETGTEEVWIHRLCGLEGDKVEIRDGCLFINNRDADSKLSLCHQYQISPEELEKARAFEEIESGYGATWAFICDKTIRENHIKANMWILGRGEKDEMMEKVYGKPWNRDNFGPITVPKGKYFVLGDNRHNALDSRYIGFIDKQDFAGTAMGI